MMNSFSGVPPGFRFHPTDEELVDYYLRKKVNSRRIDLDIIKDVDLYKIEPWDLQELCRMTTAEEEEEEGQNEWYFFSHKDKKYPTGTRTNRATAAGFWKATGRDKAIYSKHDLIGMRKTLVFYKGRAPHGQKSDWIMHEYRLETDENGPPQEEGWAVCKVFKKRLPTVRRMSEHGSPYWYDDRSSFMPDLQSPNQSLNPTDMASSYHRPPYPCKRDLGIHYQLPPEHLLHLPFLENPKLLLSPFGLDVDQSTGLLSSSSLVQEQNNLQPPVIGKLHGNHKPEAAVDQVTDWRVLDKFVASQLSHDEGAPEVNANGTAGQLALMKADVVSDDASMQTSASCEMELWK